MMLNVRARSHIGAPEWAEFTRTRCAGFQVRRYRTAEQVRLKYDSEGHSERIKANMVLYGPCFLNIYRRCIDIGRGSLALFSARARERPWKNDQSQFPGPKIRTRFPHAVPTPLTWTRNRPGVKPGREPHKHAVPA